MTLVVVGTFRPASDLGWESDPLTGAGVDPDYSDGARTATAYGPFVVDDAAFLASGSAAARLRVTARPDVTHADRESVTAAVEALRRRRGSARGRPRRSRAAHPGGLPAAGHPARVETNLAASRSLVLVTVLLGATLSLTALLLAGRLVAAVRDEERVLLVAFGASRRQQLAATGFEAVLLALVAAALALPAAALVHSRLTHLAGPTAAGLAQAPAITGGLVLTVLGCTLALAPVLVLTAVDTSTTTAATRRRWALGRVHADWTLMVAAGAAAVLAWWQLRDQPDTAAGRWDPIAHPRAGGVRGGHHPGGAAAGAGAAARRRPAGSPLAGPGAAAVGPAGGPASAPGHGHGADRDRGRDGDVRARAPLDLGTITGGPGGPAGRHRPEPRRPRDADPRRCGGRARRRRRAVHGRLGGDQPAGDHRPLCRFDGRGAADAGRGRQPRGG